MPASLRSKDSVMSASMVSQTDDHEIALQASEGSPANSPAEDAVQDNPDAAPGKPRTRRRKARRACANCQRAHLTCEDERPCMRCTRRGLAHNCHDGARKKAKYLYDAPDGSLDSSLFSAAAGDTSLQSQQAQTQALVEPLTVSTAATTGQNPIAPADDPHQQPPLQHANSRSASGSIGQPPDTGPFDIDVANLNFDNYFGALEFGILGHMSSAAIGSSDDGIPISPSDASMANMSASTPGSVDANGYNMNLYSPTTNPPMHWQYPSQPMQQPPGRSYDGSSLAATSFATPQQRALQPVRSLTITHGGRETTSGPQPYSRAPDEPGTDQWPESSRANFQRHTLEATGPPKISTSSIPIRRDASHIYTSVNTPYSYTAGFHALAALLQRRFTSQKTLRIAKALASIRPSFITCTKDLKLDDLTFMEKCFQRTLLQYDDFINAYGCPTIICRRTGELAAASKEFTQMTGWQGDVLLGNKPNLNVNHGTPSATTSAARQTEPLDSARKAAVNNARANRTQGANMDRVQPVFLAELLDEDSVVQFYEDFAELAFGDPRGHVVRPCKLLKYLVDRRETSGTSATPKGSSIDCMYCWSVKRDVFDIPMLIVINFLPRF